MSALKIITLPTGTDEATIAELRACGYIPVVTDKPDLVRIVVAGSQVQANDMLMAALHGLNQSTQQHPRSEFTRELYYRLQQREGLQ